MDLSNTEEIICTYRLPTKDLSPRELIKRDHYLRQEHGFSQLTSPVTYNTEEQVMAGVVNSFCYQLGFPYLYGYEYECAPGFPQGGKGDLVLVDGKGSFLAVECKRLEFNICARGARTKKRKKVRKQAQTYCDDLLTHLKKCNIKYTGDIRGIAVVNNPDATLGQIEEVTPTPNRMIDLPLVGLPGW